MVFKNKKRILDVFEPKRKTLNVNAKKKVCMKCFIAIDLPENTKKIIEEKQKELLETCFKEHNEMVKPVKKENFHITLHFFGEIPEEKTKKIKEKLYELNQKTFQVFFSGFGVFPSKDFIKVLWVGIKENKKLEELYTKLCKIIETKPKKLVAHITIARIKYLDANTKKCIQKFLAKNTVQQSFKIKTITLFESILTKTGPKYNALTRIKLKQEAK